MIWSAGSNRASDVPIEIVHAAGKKQLSVNQKKGGGWAKILHRPLPRRRRTSSLTIRTTAADGHVIADAVRFVPVDEKR